MKKTILLFIFISLFYIFISNVMAKTIEIPDDAIRIRIIPNSNKYHDQEIKNKVKDKIQIKMYKMLKTKKNSEEAEVIIKNNLESIDKNIKKILEKENYNKEYKINFGYNYFPKKEYKGVIYKEGYYKSLLITLGEGKGDNWWCVLFPPLCLIEAEKTKTTEYKSFIKEIIDKHL
ncbi:MAG: stage II sporulation protein R [Bacilli bacterium]|nr:stage II sporulation protein R [Bacilli bacterium]